MFLILIQLIAFASAETIFDEISDIITPEDGRLNCTQLATKYGLYVEEVEVTTDDGYILKMFHIPGKKKPVFLLHGIGDSSTTWLLRGYGSMAVALAGEGYDLWLGNVRGNRYGRKHVSLNPDSDKKFWDFSFHEMGYYDCPAMINKVLEETNQTKVDAIAHSQGTTSLFVLMSTRPEYNEKINLFICLAPVALLNQPGPTLTALIKIGPIALALLESSSGTGDFFSYSRVEKQVAAYLCYKGVLPEEICERGFAFPICGYDTDGIDDYFFSVIYGQFPSGISLKTLSHYDKVALSGKFAYYDYGIRKNIDVYKSPVPPEYDLSKVIAKTAFLYGENDLLTSEVNVKQISKLMPNLVYLKAIEKKEWNHIDFTWGSETKTYLYHLIFDLLQTY